MDRFLELFPREQILVLLFDDMKQDLSAFLRKIFLFLNVDPAFVPPNLEKRYNPASITRLAWMQRAIRGLGPKIMRMDMPDWLFSLLKKIRGIVWRINTKPVVYPPMSDSIRRQLVLEMDQTIDFVEESPKIFISPN